MEDIMRRFRLVLIAMLLAVPFAVTAMAQDVEEDQDVGVGPALAAAPMDYGPPVCSWGYYSYYPYSCAPYGYYGPGWFRGGLFLGVGPWYGWGWGHGWGRGGYGNRGGYGVRGVAAGRGAYANGSRGSVAGGARGYAGGSRGYAGGARGNSGGARLPPVAVCSGKCVV